MTQWFVAIFLTFVKEKTPRLQVWNLEVCPIPVSSLVTGIETGGHRWASEVHEQDKVVQEVTASLANAQESSADVALISIFDQDSMASLP